MRFSAPWSTPPVDTLCRSTDVHVWLADLDQQSRHNMKLQDHLSEAERARAQRFLRQRDREHFIAARGTLRQLLGRYLSVEPRSIAFVLGPYGKPALDPQVHPLQLQFNISHSAGLALFAFSNGRAIGVDIEYERPIADMESIAERFFSPRETAALTALPNHMRQQAFFACWSRKEAYIKGTGRGLSQSLSAFDVSLKPDDLMPLLAVTDDPNDVTRWSLRALSTVPGYAAALAVEGHDWSPSCWVVSDPSL